MRPDPGRVDLDAARRGWTASERLALAAELRDQAFDLAWAALREREAAVGRLDDLERACFILARLYPELAGQQLADVMEALARRQAQGTWRGFAPPASFVRAGGLP